jgi:membrane protease YdiL (CAAX protease family)
MRAKGWLVSRAVLLTGVVVLGPVSEELFFRGWLWTALRRFCFPVPAMLATSTPWLAQHMLDDIRAPLRLMPLAIVLSMAHHFCRSIRASIALHLPNNPIGVGIIASLYTR